MDLMSLQYDESFEIDLRGTKIKVTLLKNKENPDEYAFGVDAPRSVAINREEIYQRKKQAKSKRPAKSQQASLTDA